MTEVSDGQQFVPSHFHVDLKTISKSQPDVLQELKVSVSGPNSNDNNIETHVKESQDAGIYTVSYTPNETGTHRITVALKGKTLYEGTAEVSELGICIFSFPCLFLKHLVVDIIEKKNNERIFSLMSLMS